MLQLIILTKTTFFCRVVPIEFNLFLLVYVESTQVFQNELLRQKVPVTFHLFPEGGHGYGMQAEATFEVSRWPVFLEEWLTDNGFGPRSMEE